MQYVLFGNTDLQVSRLCLGTAEFGSRVEWKECIRLVHLALDAGVNFIDTANVYGTDGAAEKILGIALSGRRHEIILATKVGARPEGAPDAAGAGRGHILQQIEVSLKRLGTDWIDLYQLHQPDPTTPVEETLRAMDDLVAAGKVRFFGTCNHEACQIRKLIETSRHLRLCPVSSEQSQYNLLERTPERDLLPLAREHGLAFLPWSPLAGGLLSGRYRTADPSPEGSRRADGWRLPMTGDIDEILPLLDRLIGIARDAGLPLSQLALAWLLAQDAVTAPIIGPRVEAQLHDNLRALEVALSPEVLHGIERTVPGVTDESRRP